MRISMIKNKFHQRARERVLFWWQQSPSYLYLPVENVYRDVNEGNYRFLGCVSQRQSGKRASKERSLVPSMYQDKYTTTYLYVWDTTEYRISHKNVMMFCNYNEVTTRWFAPIIANFILFFFPFFCCCQSLLAIKIK